jgi:putative endonuclease
MFYIYIIYSVASDRFYVGHSQDPWHRLEQHLSNRKDKYTGRNSDWELQAVFKVGVTRGEADKLEKYIKRQKSRRLIELLVKKDFVPEGKLAQLVRVPHVRD